MDGLGPKSCFGSLMEDSSFVLCRLPRPSSPLGRAMAPDSTGWVVTLPFPAAQAGDEIAASTCQQLPQDKADPRPLHSHSHLASFKSKENVPLKD